MKLTKEISRSIQQKAKLELEKMKGRPRVNKKRIYSIAKGFIKSVGAAKGRQLKKCRLYSKRNLQVIYSTKESEELSNVAHQILDKLKRGKFHD